MICNQPKPLSEYNLTMQERTDVIEMLRLGFELEDALDAVYDNSAFKDEQEMYQDLRMGAF